MTAECKNIMTKETPEQKPRFYKLSAAELPDELFRKEADADEWIGDYTGNSSDCTAKKMPWLETTSNPKGFRPGGLHKVVPIDPIVEIERTIGIPMYMIANISPFVVPLATLVWLITGFEFPKKVAILVAAYHGGLYAIWRILLVPIFLKRYNRGSKLVDDLDPNDHFHSQYLFTERNVTKYCSISYVWPESLQRPSLTNPDGMNGDRPIIFCMIPHGLAPYGIVGYPFFSKVWNSKLCSWTTAPNLLKIPIVGHYLKAIGCVPAKSKPIFEALTKQNRNIGIILDGIDGMFHSQAKGHTEAGAILDRKGICKIALKANATIVPVYGFGHTGVYDVVVDPFGILRFLSSKLNLSLTPFFGRWGWFLGPPKRDVPVTMCLGDPIYPPDELSGDEDDSVASIAQKDIDDHHAKLLEGFTRVFETHKRGYYGEALGDKKKLVFVNHQS